MTGAMRAHTLAHAVFYVRDLQESLRFWRDLVGFEEVGSAFGGRAAALRGSDHTTHHELLILQVGDVEGPDDRPANEPRRGLYHVGVKVGDSLDELRQAKAELDEAGVAIDGASDHTVTWSLYVRDPDGNEVELYCDNPDVDWEKEPERVLAPIQPLEL